MNPQLIVPNLHVILIHYPLGVFFLGMLIELGGLVLWRRHPVRVVGRWMILLGGLSMWPAVTSGLYAMQDLVSHHGQAQGTWAQVVAGSPLTADAWLKLKQHLLIMSVATGLISIVIVSFLAASDRMRDRLYAPMLLLLLMSTGIMTRAAWLSGEAIYRQGAGVEAVDPHAVKVLDAGTVVPADAASSGRVKEATGENSETTNVLVQVFETTRPADLPGRVLAMSDRVDMLFPPVQSHAVMAGLAFAVALAALGLSIRQITAVVPEEMPSDPAQSLLRSLEPPPIVTPLYPGRVWAATCIVLLLTAVGGVYVLAKDADSFVPKELWQMVIEKSDSAGPVPRRLAHLIAGVSLIVLPIVLGLLARFAPRQKTALAIFTFLLLLALAAQVWIGALLLFDGPAGNLLRFS